MKAVIIGAGHIGCGFAGQLFNAAGCHLLFVARNPSLVDHFNRVGCYRVRLVNGAKTQEHLIAGVQALPSHALAQVAVAIAEADLVAVSVGANNLPDVAPLIAAGLRRRARPLNILAFENLTDAGAQVRRLVAHSLPLHFPLNDHGLSGVLASRVVTERIGDPAGCDPLIFVGDPLTEFVVDGLHLRQPLPQVPGMVVANNYVAWIQRKLYMYSAGHATTAYLGYLKGYHYIHTAIRDPEIRAAALAAMAEGQQGLLARYGSELAGGEEDLHDIIARFENAALNDPIARVARDPRRKLGAEDRLVGAARLAAGIVPEKLALVAAAALYFTNPADPSAAALQQEIKTLGPSNVLQRVSGLDAEQGLGRAVIEGWSRLAAGWRNGNLLLSLERLLWALRS
jgi:mannitol-1-phosphate 5-dehydrogenase